MIALDGHFVSFGPTGWSVEHSAGCDATGFDCPFYAAIARTVDRTVEGVELLGRFRILEVDAQGLPSLQREEL